MMRRLVLGCDAVGTEVVERMADWPGDLAVVDSTGSRVESLRDRGIHATEGDLDDPTDYPEQADVVLVADTDPQLNHAAATTAREKFPDALLIAYAGTDPEQPDSVAAPRTKRRDLAAIADRTIDPTAALAEGVNAAATGTATKVHRLFRILREQEGPLAVVTHDNPDPDAIASAVGLCRIARQLGVAATPCYFGEITHQENRALVNLLGLELHNLDAPEDIEEYAAVALVDHSRPGVNDQLDPDTEISIVVDHHPPRGPVEARFVDLRPEIGATSTLVTDYFDRLGRRPEADVAGALLYGIRIDTKEFTREVSTADFQAAASLIGDADTETLRKIESPSVSAEVLELLATAIQNRAVRGSTLTTCVGPLADRDALAQAAEQLLNMEGITTTVVYGFADGTVYVSGRARGSEVDLGEVLRDAFDQIGSAGGHADMAGAQIPLGILGDTPETDVESLSKIVTEVIDERLFEALEDATAPLEGTDFTYELGPRSLDEDARTAVKVNGDDRQDDADVEMETSEE
jgi:nanoRNase/pAp phosphatase (c-di-AMP/oligoRNAs hydrolase)